MHFITFIDAVVIQVVVMFPHAIKGTVSIWRRVFQEWDSHIPIIFIMAFPILLRRYIYIATAQTVGLLYVITTTTDDNQ